MRGRRPAPLVLVLLVAVVVTGCSSQPESQARASEAPATAAPPPGAGSPAPTMEPTPEPTPAAAEATEAPTTAPTAAPGIPPKPGDPTWNLLASEPAKAGRTKLTYQAGWTSPDGAATSFILYGVTKCLRDAKKNQDKPCVVKGMRIPKDVLVKIKEVPGDQRSTDVSYEQGKSGGAPWSAVLIRAVNDAGNSIFTILWSDLVCWQCTS